MLRSILLTIFALVLCSTALRLNINFPARLYFAGAQYSLAAESHPSYVTLTPGSRAYVRTMDMGNTDGFKHALVIGATLPLGSRADIIAELEGDVDVLEYKLDGDGAAVALVLEHPGMTETVVIYSFERLQPVNGRRVVISATLSCLGAHADFAFERDYMEYVQDNLDNWIEECKRVATDAVLNQL
jgi:hypothetical protein